MKTFSGFLYITDKVVVNPELKPDEIDYTYNYSTGKNMISMISEDYEQALAEWESENIEVENVDQPIEKYHVFVQYRFGSSLKKFYEGQPCTCKMLGEKAIVLTLK